MSEESVCVRGPHPTGVRAICKECESIVLKDTEHEAWETVENHNTKRHDGDDIAGVCEWDVAPLLPRPSEIIENGNLDLLVALGSIQQAKTN